MAVKSAGQRGYEICASVSPPIRTLSEQSSTVSVQMATAVSDASPLPTSLDESSVIDISHESLIRKWDRLRGWVEEEARSAAMYRRLAEGAGFGDGWPPLGRPLHWL